MTDEKPRTYIVYHGPQRHGGSWVYEYAIHQSEDRVAQMEPNFTAAKKLKLSLQPGLVYSFAGSFIDDTVNYTQKSQRFHHRPPNADRIAANARAADLAKSIEKKGSVPWTDCLAPARDAYRNAKGIQKQIVLALAVAAITGRRN